MPNDLDTILNIDAKELTGVDDPILDQIIAHYRKIRGMQEEGTKNTKKGSGAPKLDISKFAVAAGLKTVAQPIKRRI